MTDSLRIIESLSTSGAISSIDLHFSKLIARLAADSSPELLLGAALTSRRTGQGHVCLDLKQAASRPLPGEGRQVPAPSLERWTSRLRDTKVVGNPGQLRPLILDRSNRLYLYRYWEYQHRLTQDLRRRASALPVVDEAGLKSGLEALFAAPAPGPVDWQKVSAAVASLKGLCVISGGPGSGKTTTAVSALALLATLSRTGLRVALAAPTGKAAARLEEAVRDRKSLPGLPPQAVGQIPDKASTLHRLLGYRPDSVTFRHNRDNPLPLDVLLIDEASMVDLALMAKLVEALPAQARLILLGDKDQLASVEAGAVLADLCAGSEGFSPNFSARLSRLTGESIPAREDNGSDLGDCIVLLRHSYRFPPDSAIGSVARSVNQRKGAQAIQRILSDRSGEASWHGIGPGFQDNLAARLVEALRGYLLADSPEEAFARFGSFRLLTALRDGPYGVRAMNRLAEEALTAAGLIDSRQDWYRGKPVLIVENDYSLRLFNGDVGIAFPDPAEGGQLRISFPSPQGSLRRISPSRLPPHELAYALTVHKSQGSEFGEVAIVLPAGSYPIMTRELIYTAVTRARNRLEIWGDQDVFKEAVARSVVRTSGLRDGLWSRPAEEPPKRPVSEGPTQLRLF